jgi:hypothetical protein
VGLDVTDQILCFCQILEKNGSTLRLQDFKEAYDSARREVMYSVLTDIGLPTLRN